MNHRNRFEGGQSGNIGKKDLFVRLGLLLAALGLPTSLIIKAGIDLNFLETQNNGSVEPVAPAVDTYVPTQPAAETITGQTRTPVPTNASGPELESLPLAPEPTDASTRSGTARKSQTNLSPAARPTDATYELPHPPTPATGTTQPG